MPRRQNYWKEYYAKNKHKYQKYHCRKYSYKLTVNGNVYYFDKKQDIQIERIEYQSKQIK